MPKKITYPKNIQKLKSQLEGGNNLVDYFFVCGVNPNICLNEDLYNFTDKDYIINLKKILKPTIISKFPEFDNNNDSIGEEIIDYCFPDGFDLYPYYAESLERKIFSIILDNNLCSSEYPQKYLTCLIFYEKLSQYFKLKQNIQKSETNKEQTPLILNENLPNINLKKQRTQYKHNKIVSSQLPTFQKIGDEFIMDPTDFDTSLDDQTRISTFQSSNDLRLNYYFIPKCICLVSIHPYIKKFQKILSNIYQYSISSSLQIPIEKIITNLIIEVPIPPRGLYSIDYTLVKADNILNLKNSENNKLLITELDLKKFNSNLKLNTIMETLKHILFGSKILFFSIDLNLISDTILAFLYLLFPFKYPFQVSSYLSKNNYCILESISPFMMGIKEKYNESFFDKNDINKEGMNIFILDLDDKKHYLFTDEEFFDFPSKQMSFMDREIKMLEKDQLSDIEFNEQYQKKFFHFFCELLKNYEEYLNMDYFKSSDSDQLTSINTLFACEKFINSHNSNDISFYEKFVLDSQLFADFIYKRMIPRNNQELVDILLVNDLLNRLRRKSKLFGINALFSEGEEYAIKNKYIVPKARELSDKEKKNIIKKINELNQKGQLIKNEKENIFFSYILFPSLDFEIYCNDENVNEYIPPPDYSEEIEAINNEMILKSSLGQNINRTLEMKNYLYLTWLEIWAYTFWYNDISERNYRFNQMLDILDKVIHHEMNIFNLMFDVLKKQNQDQMILKLYQKLLQLKQNPSTFIYNIISNILDKGQIKKLFDEIKTKSSKQLKFDNCNEQNNRERTFLSINDDFPLDTMPKFYFEFYCIQCNQKINLLTLCKNFNGIKNDILWVPCKKCGEYNLPKISVRFGLDLIENKKNDKNKANNNKTLPIDEIVLHDPYNLKINIRDAVKTHYGTNIDIPSFKSQFKPLFWNFIWYCRVHDLDYKILLPYSKNLEQLKEIEFHNPNREILKAIDDDKRYKNNQKKIKLYTERFLKENFQDKIIIKNIFDNECMKKVNVENLKYTKNDENETENNQQLNLRSTMQTNTLGPRPKITMFENYIKTEENDKKKDDLRKTYSYYNK